MSYVDFLNVVIGTKAIMVVQETNNSGEDPVALRTAGTILSMIG